MASTGKKKNLKTVIWLLIIVLLAFLMFWSLYQEFKSEREFQKHKERERNQSS